MIKILFTFSLVRKANGGELAVLIPLASFEAIYVLKLVISLADVDHVCDVLI